MKEHNCQVVSKEELVAYVDGELSPSQAEQIAGHIAGCESCRAMADALERSLHVTRVIWQTGEAQWPKTYRLGKLKSSRRLLKPAAVVAASILLILGISVSWRLLSGSSERTRTVSGEPTAAEIGVVASRAALAAQMLAVADLFAGQPGGEEYAMKRYTYVIDSFPGKEESAQARLRLNELIERRVKQ